MRVETRRATPENLDVLEELYRGLEREMVTLHPMWPLADGLDEPVRESLAAELSKEETLVLIGFVDDYPFGFLLARVEGLLSQAKDERVGSVRLIYVDQEAREVGVAEMMRDTFMEDFRRRGITKFDAHVLPGHRLAKNFFESGGFSARSIVMFHDDNR